VGENITTETPLLFAARRVYDERGYFQKILDPGKIRISGVKEFQAVEMFSTSTRQYGIRGMHIQVSPHQSRKLVWVTHGEILDVLINMESKEVFTFELKEDSELVLYVPQNYAHGFQALSEKTIVNYLTDIEYHQASDTGFNPLSFGFHWPKPIGVMSERDMNLVDFEEFCESD